MPKNLRRLGIQNLNMFNKALLAKNGWRLILNPNSLWAKVLQAKSFPNTKFFASKKEVKFLLFMDKYIMGKRVAYSRYWLESMKWQYNSSLE